MMEPCRQYLKLIRLKKCKSIGGQFQNNHSIHIQHLEIADVIDIITEIHCCLNRITASMKPATCSRKPENLCEAVKFAACEAAVGMYPRPRLPKQNSCWALTYIHILTSTAGCAKVLQLCNIFVKDGAGMSRYQRHEVIKYVKSQLPTFLAQAHQFLQNVLAVLTNLTEEEKTELIIYLVPETEATLSLMTDVISEVKMSLERVCTDLSKNSSADASTTEATCDDQQDAEQQQRVTAKSDDVNTLERGRRLKRLADSEHNFKFVLYIYEVKKLRDIYGRVSTALDIIEQKRYVLETCKKSVHLVKTLIFQNCLLRNEWLQSRANVEAKFWSIDSEHSYIYIDHTEYIQQLRWPCRMERVQVLFQTGCQSSR